MSSGSAPLGAAKKSATDREIEHATQLGKDEEARNEEVTAHINAARERNRAAYESSEQGAAARQVKQAESDMRGPSPAPGFTEGDPLQGPAS
jgi:hypothetical protein